MRLHEYAKKHGRDVSDVVAAAVLLNFDKSHPMSTIDADEEAYLDIHFAADAKPDEVEVELAAEVIAEATPSPVPVAEQSASVTDDAPGGDSEPAVEAVIEPPAPVAPRVMAEPAAVPSLLDMVADVLRSESRPMYFNWVANRMAAKGWKPPKSVRASDVVRRAVVDDANRDPNSRFSLLGNANANPLVRLK